MPEKVKSHFSRMLKNLIQQRGITFEELASHIGVTKQTVSNYCLGKSVPNYDVLIKIAEYFSVSGDFLLTGVRVQDKADSEKLGLSGEAIRLLKSCDENTLEVINVLLSDKKFYSLLQKINVEFNANVERVFNLLQIPEVRHLAMTEEFNNETLGEFLCNSFIVDSITRSIQEYIENFLIEKTMVKEIIKNIDDNLKLAGNSEKTAKKTAVRRDEAAMA